VGRVTPSRTPSGCNLPWGRYTFRMQERHPYLLPVAIVLAGVLLAAAIYLVRSTDPSPLRQVGTIRPVSSSDHIVGSPEASVIVVEYSDIDCAYCKEFQATMAQLMTEYGPNGTVAWVYRHFPLINLHEHAATHAEAAECVAAEDENKFFPFIDALQQAAPGSREFDPQDYESVVASLGLSIEAFTECMASDRMVERVTKDFENAADAGGTGTPYIVILVKGSDPIPVTGALPYESMKEVIERARSAAK
jgi:protein-disulfide isomerase